MVGALLLCEGTNSVGQHVKLASGDIEAGNMGNSACHLLGSSGLGFESPNNKRQ